MKAPFSYILIWWAVVSGEVRRELLENRLNVTPGSFDYAEFNIIVIRLAMKKLLLKVGSNEKAPGVSISSQTSRCRPMVMKRARTMVQQ